MKNDSLNNSNDTHAEKNYNLNELIQLSNGSNDFVANMLEIFVRSSSEILFQMNAALLINDWEKVSSAAHKAIPSFHFMGLINFSEKFKFIESYALEEKNQQRIREMIGFIDKNMVVIGIQLNEKIQKFKISK